MSTQAVAADIDALDELGQRVIDRLSVPKDSWEIAAQLEVLGLRDSDARNRYGARDLFELARTIEGRFRDGQYAFIVEGEDPRPRVIPILRFARLYLSGIAFAAPMAVQAAAILIWGYGLWGALDLTLTQGSAIALGFITSYVVAGGFTQAIVRRGLFYVYQQEEILARATALRGFALAVRALLLLAIPAVAANAIFQVLPWSMLGVSLLFYALLGILWLTWALLYLVRKTWSFVIVTAAGLAVVIAAAKLLHLPSVTANALGVAAADAMSFALAWIFLGRMAKRSAAEPINPPRIEVLVFSTSRYFVYGLLFNAFLFADRLIAWTTTVGREDFPPYPFWLNVRYELAMDLALVVAMLMSGVVEFAIERFSEELVPLEKKSKSEDVRAFVAEHLRMHRRRSAELMLAAIVAAGAAIAVFAALLRVPSARLHEALTAAVTLRVFVAASVGYIFFTFGVRNLLLLLTLSRVEPAVRSVAIALATDVVIGFVCSRAFHYATAVAGLVVGAIVLAIVSGRAVRRTLEQLDYFYFAAF